MTDLPWRVEVPAAKVRDYLLNEVNPANRGKAALFARFGFAQTDWTCLRDQLAALFDRAAAVRSVSVGPATKIVIDGEITGLDGRRLQLRTVWLVEFDTARMVTAYPAPLRLPRESR